MRKKILILSAIIVIAGGLVTWYFVSQPKTITVSRIYPFMDVPELTQKADIIVVGTITKKLPSRWVRMYPQEEPGIYTDVVVEVEEYLKNPLGQKEVTVRLSGGTVGNVIQVTMDEVTLNLGEKVLLFLTKDMKGNFVSWGEQGKYTIDEVRGMAVNEDTARNLPVKQLKTQIEEVMGKSP